MRTRPIPERFCGGDSLRRGAISSVCTFTFTFRMSAIHLLYYYYYTVSKTLSCLIAGARFVYRPDALPTVSKTHNRHHAQCVPSQTAALSPAECSACRRPSNFVKASKDSHRRRVALSVVSTAARRIRSLDPVKELGQNAH